MANYQIEDIEGIGEVTGKKFRDAGVKDTDALLAASTTPSARARLAEATGLSAAQVLKFANMADLYRITVISGFDVSDPALAPLRAAALLQVGHLYANREGGGSEAFWTGPVAALINPMRDAW